MHCVNFIFIYSTRKVLALRWLMVDCVNKHENKLKNIFFRGVMLLCLYQQEKPTK